MNYTYKQIWLINFPVMMSILMEQLINITDAIFLGHVGEVELGASALAGIYYLAVYMLGFGLKTGNNNPCSRHNSLFVRNIDDGEYIRLRSVDFVEGASTFKASASCHLYGGEIEIRLDNEEGQLIGRLSIDNTKTAYQTFETKVEKVSGVHDLYLVFRGCKQQKKNLFLLDWWEFEK